MRRLIGALGALVWSLCGAAIAAPAPAAAPASLPAAAARHDQIILSGKPLAYTATAGAITLRDPAGSAQGEISYLAFTADGAPREDRPITFVFGGGPGYSSASLDFRLAGPKLIAAPGDRYTPSTPPRLVDNPDTWLAFTDLVFVDPVGVGWSRSDLGPEETRKTFMGWKQDIASLSRFVALYLADNGRMVSPKYVAGESYGGFRTPQVARHLQIYENVGVRGMIMISPVIDFSLRLSRNGPIDWATHLPTMAAARIERDTGRDVDPAALAPAEAYAFGEYLTDLMRPRTDEAAQQRMAKKVAAFTGLDPALVLQMAGRIDPATYDRELRRGHGLLGSRYDATNTAFDPWTERPDAAGIEPADGHDAPVASAMNDYVQRILGWKPGAPYTYAGDRLVSKRWDYPSGRVDATDDLRMALAQDPELKLIVAHGATDFVTPYMASRIILDQLPPPLLAGRVRQTLYAGGHGFYERSPSRHAFTADVRALYEAR